jgi:hypothetical protein
MVRAILSGAKTQTRRTMKFQPLEIEGSKTTWEMLKSGAIGCPLERAPEGSRPFRTFLFDRRPNGMIHFAHCNYGRKPKGKLPKSYLQSNDPERWSEGEVARICPYGKSGDRLWVRETFCGCNWKEVGKRYAVMKDGEQVYENGQRYAKSTTYAPGAFDNLKWKPSIFMPRWASRITLEIVNVRVERLQDISDEDCFAEGLTDPDGKIGWAPSTAPTRFGELWDSINGEKHPWKSNPWVWVVEFKRIMP